MSTYSPSSILSAKHYEQVRLDETVLSEYLCLLDKVFSSDTLAQGEMTREFESLFSESVGLRATSTSSGSGGLYALLSLVDILGKDVIVPTCSCVAVPLTVVQAGGKVIFSDCKKEDLCIGVENIQAVITDNTSAVIVIHVAGNIAIDILDIKEFCDSRGIALIEDCCHADGSTYMGLKPGQFGMAGFYSFHASKMMPIGEGGMVVSSDEKVVQFVEKFKNYDDVYCQGGLKRVRNGFNLCMSDVTAALGIAQLNNFHNILDWKRKIARRYDQVFTGRLHLPSSMNPNYYMYPVFQTKIKTTTGKLFNSSKHGMLSHELMGRENIYPNSQWLNENHECVPINYKCPYSERSVSDLRESIVSISKVTREQK